MDLGKLLLNAGRAAAALQPHGAIEADRDAELLPSRGLRASMRVLDPGGRFPVAPKNLLRAALAEKQNPKILNDPKPKPP